MNHADVKTLVEAAGKMKLTQAQVASHLSITAGYWYQILRGRKPLTEEVLVKVRSLNKKLRAFAQAG